VFSVVAVLLTVAQPKSARATTDPALP